MGAGRQDLHLDPATLRERASQCLQLAATLPSYANAETLKRIAGDYLKMADQLERAERIEGRRPGNA
jgi:hypothetical protein